MIPTTLSEAQAAHLIAEASAVRSFAYAPYSNFSVGAALLTSAGKVYRGCNVENASYGLTVCAERAAVAAAVSSGDRAFQAIAITAGNDDTCAPCGACRQFLLEFSPDMLVISARKDGSCEVQSVSSLLPSSFSAASLQKNKTS